MAHAWRGTCAACCVTRQRLETLTCKATTAGVARVGFGQVMVLRVNTLLVTVCGRDGTAPSTMVMRPTDDVVVRVLLAKVLLTNANWVGGLCASRAHTSASVVTQPENTLLLTAAVSHCTVSRAMRAHHHLQGQRHARHAHK